MNLRSPHEAPAAADDDNYNKNDVM